MFATYLLLLVAIALLYYLGSRKPKGYPPGPRWWPVVGCAFEVGRIRKDTGYLFKTCSALASKYGPVVGLKIGSDRIVVLNDLTSMRSMYANEDCDGRPTGPIYQARTWGARRGLLVVDGKLWIEQRRFVLRHLREFGLGRKDMATIVEDEAARLVEHLKALYVLNNSVGETQRDGAMPSIPEAGIVIPMHSAFGVAVLNGLWRMMASKRYDHDDEELNYLQRILTKLLEEIDMIGAPFSHFPILRSIAPGWSGYKTFLDTHRQLWKFLRDELEKHKTTIDPAAPRDLMDAYLLALKSTDISSTFSESQLLAICMDLFMAGSETTSKTLGFAFLHLLLRKDVQKRAQTEIDRVVSRDRYPTLADRSRMPYVNAIVLESLRMFMGRTLNIPHRALRDTYILEHRIPKDTMIVVNFNRVLMDEGRWENPEEFRPERFLDDTGGIAVPDEYFPFSLARHRCMGEVLARSNVFLIIATLLQTFEFSKVPGETLPKPGYVDGVTSGPSPYRALVTLRG